MGGEKILVHKSISSHNDFDLEAGAHGITLPERGSTYSLTSDGSSTHERQREPISPATAAATTWMRPPSTMAMGGPYDTHSELVTVVPGANGRNVLVATPTPALAVMGRHERPDSRNALGRAGTPSW